MSKEQIPLRHEKITFYIDETGALVSEINGTRADTEGCINAAVEWFNNDEIRNPKAVKLWERLCEFYGDVKLAETYFSFNNPYKVHIFRSDFLADPEETIRNIARLFRKGGERRAQDIEEWYRRETERDKRTDEREY